ncbi:MAG: hypothetical protein IT546_14895 [Caulobacteraceae bacterium]|nr:hypothetical protein [Caulobacteraceae bacterium]
MARWARVKWTEAGQVVDLAEATAAQSPEVYFAGLRQAGELTDAAFFLGRALPRHETVAWAARAVRDLPGGETLPRGDVEALRAALLWVQDPSEPRRRAAYEAAMTASDKSAEQMAALAAFFSGGSMAPDGHDPVQAPMDAAGTFAAGAVVLAAVRTGDMDGALAKVLDAGDRIAEKGLAADA